MSQKQILKSLISKDHIAEVLTELYSATAKIPRLHNEVIQLSGRFQLNERKRRLDVVHNDDVNREYNKIRDALLAIIDELPEIAVLPPSKKTNWVAIATFIVGLVALIANIGTIKDTFFGNHDTKEAKPIDKSQKIDSPSTTGSINKPIQPVSQPAPKTNPLDENKFHTTIVEPSIESNTDTYFSKNRETDVAILATSEYKKSDAKTSSDVSQYFTSKGLANNPVFFKSPFLSKFSERLRDNDVSVFKSLEVQKMVNCVCLINQENLKIEPQEYENNSFKKASASYSISLFYLNGSVSPQTFQFDDMTGAGANDNMAQASLKDNFITAFKNLSINFNQCKK